MRRHVTLALAAVVAMSLVIRAVPTLTSGEPFSLDAWPLIRDAQVILKSPEVRIWNDSVLGGYNNRWPGTILSSVIYSLLSGLSITDTYRFFGPAVTMLATLLLVYVIVKRISGNALSSSLALAYFASAPSLLVFTSATIKEVCAYPLLYSLIFLLTAPQLRCGAFVALSLVLATSISATHPLASFMAVGLGFSASLVYVTLSATGRGACRASQFSLLRSTTLALMVATIFTAYLMIYGGAGFNYPIGVGDIITYITYASFTYVTYFLFSVLRKRRAVPATLMIAIFTALLILTPHKSLLPGLGAIKSLTVILYAAPAILPLLLVVRSPNRVTTPWIYALGAGLLVAVNAAYTVLAKPEMSTIFHRVANYVVLANTFLLAHSALRPDGKLRLLALVIVVVTAACSVATVSSVVTGADGVSYYWYYRLSEVYSLNTVDALAGTSLEFLGDAKVAYYFSIVRSVHSGTFLKALMTGTYRPLGNGLVLLYRDNFIWGYVISLNTVDVRGHLHFIYGLSKVFDGASVYAFKATGWGV